MELPKSQYQPVFVSTDSKLAVGDFKGLKIKQQEVGMIKDLGIVNVVETKRTLLVLDTIEPQKPISEIEAEVIQEDLKNMIKRVASLRSKLSFLHNQVDSSINSLGGENSTFTYNLSKRPRLKKAMKTVFGYAKSSITYNDYLFALNLKQRLEKEEALSMFEEEPYDG